MEFMTNGPYLQPRGGYRYGDAALIDATVHDALACSFDQRGMGASTDYNKARTIGRAEQDEFTAMSHERATHRPARSQHATGAPQGPCRPTDPA